MKIIYKDRLDRALTEVLSNPLICNKCGCYFQIEDKKEILKEAMIVDYSSRLGGIICEDMYYVECPNCKNTIEIAFGEKRAMKEEELNENCM